MPGFYFVASKCIYCNRVSGTGLGICCPANGGGALHGLFAAQPMVGGSPTLHLRGWGERGGVDVGDVGGVGHINMRASTFQ